MNRYGQVNNDVRILASCIRLRLTKIYCRDNRMEQTCKELGIVFTHIEKPYSDEGQIEKQLRNLNLFGRRTKKR